MNEIGVGTIAIGAGVMASPAFILAHAAGVAVKHDVSPISARGMNPNLDEAIL